MQTANNIQHPASCARGSVAVLDVPAPAACPRPTGRAGAQAPIPAGVPLEVHRATGAPRWYLVQAPLHRESSACALAVSVVSCDLLMRAFVPQREMWFRRAGEWRLEVTPRFGGYFVAETADPRALDVALSRLTAPVRLAGRQGRTYAFLDRRVQSWYEAVAGADGVVRASVAVPQGDLVRVVEGPLVRQEGIIRKVDRHHRKCVVEPFDGYATTLGLFVDYGR